MLFICTSDVACMFTLQLYRHVVGVWATVLCVGTAHVHDTGPSSSSGTHHDIDIDPVDDFVVRKVPLTGDALPSMCLPWCVTLWDSSCHQVQPHQWVWGSSAQSPQWRAKAHSHSPLFATSGQSDNCIILCAFILYMHKQCCIHTNVHTYIV